MNTSLINITADHGTMSSNEWIAPKMIGFEQITFHASLKSNPAVSDDITVWLKRAKDPRDDMQNDDMALPGGRRIYGSGSDNTLYCHPAFLP